MFGDDAPEGPGLRQQLGDEGTRDAVAKAPEPSPVFDVSAVSGPVANTSNTIITCRIARAVSCPRRSASSHGGLRPSPSNQGSDFMGIMIPASIKKNFVFLPLFCLFDQPDLSATSRAHKCIRGFYNHSFTHS